MRDELVEVFFLTFGVQYAHEEHPAGKWVDPDGYVEIIARDYPQARKLAFDTFGAKWSMLYDKHGVIFAFFPKGKIAELTSEGLEVL